MYASGCASTGAKGVLAPVMDTYEVMNTIIKDWKAAATSDSNRIKALVDVGH